MLERTSGVSLTSWLRSHSTFGTSPLANRSCPCKRGDGVDGVGVGGDGVGGNGVGGDGVGEMVEGDLLLTLDCRQLQQSRLSSIPESRDLAKLVDNLKRKKNSAEIKEIRALVTWKTLLSS